MKPEQDDINWEHVHIAPLPIFKDNPVEQYWSQMLQDINQKLHNLEHVSLTEPQYCELKETYEATKQEIWQELEKIS